MKESSPSIKICPKCGKEMSEEVLYCPYDGSLLDYKKIENYCVKCDKQQNISYKYCPVHGDELITIDPKQINILDKYATDLFKRSVCPKCDAWNNWEIDGGDYKCKSCNTSYSLKGDELYILGNFIVNTPPISKEISYPVISDSNYIIRHWRGENNLGFAYWVNGIFLTFILLMIITIINKDEFIHKYLGLRSTGIYMLSVYSLLIIVSFWQWIGIWRSASNHQARGGKAIWCTIAKFMVIIGILRGFVDFSRIGIPIISEGVKLSLGKDNVQPYEIIVLRKGTEIELSGGMPFGTSDAFKKQLDNNPEIKVIHLNSSGGRISEAYKMFHIIQNKKLITYTSSNCESACAIAFLGGIERYIGEKGKLGFHSITIGQPSAEIIPEFNNEIKIFLGNSGVPNYFIEKIFSTPSNNMWYPSHDELLNAKIINAVVDPSIYALTGIKDWRDAHSIDEALLKISVFSAINKYDKPVYSNIRELMVKGIQEGKTQNDIIDNIRTKIFKALVNKYAADGSDKLVIKYMKSNLTTMKYLMDRDPKACVDYMFPELSTSSPLKSIPDNLKMEELDSLAELIESSFTNKQKRPINHKLVEDKLVKVLIKLNDTHPNLLKAISNPKEYSNNPDVLSKSYYNFFKHIIDMPNVQNSSDMMRYLLTQGDKQN